MSAAETSRKPAPGGLTRRGALAASAALAACGPRPQMAADESGVETGTGAVLEALDGQTLRLDTGDEVTLAGLRAPQAAAGLGPAEPGFEASKAALAGLAVGHSLQFAPSLQTGPRDRWGRIAAHVWRAEGEGETWLQARLTAAGAARVDPEHAGTASPGAPDWDEAAAALLVREAEARAAVRGLWREAYYAVRPADAASASIGAFQIVEGVVVDVADVRGRIYLNFGPDYRTDFTASIAPDDVDGFERDRVFALPGARVRVRGFVEARNGPMISLTRAVQLEGPLFG